MPRLFCCWSHPCCSLAHTTHIPKLSRHSPQSNPDAEAKKSEGNKAFSARDYPNAIKLYTEAISLDPTNHVYYSNRCAAYTSYGMMNEAIQDGQKCVAIKRDWPKGWFRLANAQKEAQRYMDCWKTLQEGLRTHFDHADLLRLHTEVEPKKDAEERAQRAGMARDEQLKAEGNDLFKAAKFEEAIAKYTEALAACSDSQSKIAIACHNNRAGCHQQLGNHPKVIEDCCMVLEVEPNNEKALLRRGLAFEACEKFRSALADIRKLLLINPNIPMAKAAQNRLGNAVQMLKRAKK